MNIISIHQPHYHSWLGLIHKIASSDLHIILDNVQFRKRNYQNRALISNPSGSKILSIPVSNKGFQKDNLIIKDIKLAEPKKAHKQFLTLKHTYSKQPGWKAIEEPLEKIYQTHYSNLIDLNLDILKYTLKLFNITTPIKLASEMNAPGKKSDLILNLCIKTDATHYIYGSGSKSYMDIDAFIKAGIHPISQEFRHPIYKQHNGTMWTPGCIALDWYAHDPDSALKYIELLITQDLDVSMAI